MANQELDSLSWLDDEINASVFNDRRHATRFRSLMQKLEVWGVMEPKTRLIGHFK